MTRDFKSLVSTIPPSRHTGHVRTHAFEMIIPRVWLGQTRESWVGFEPTHDGFANRSVNRFATRTVLSPLKVPVL